MQKIVINEKGIEYDTLMIKARAIVKNENNNIYVCNLNNNYMLPGGTVEAGETPNLTIKRELEEELGLTDFEVEELIEIDYYHYQFPKYRSESFENRLNKVYYYTVKIDSTKLGNQHFTEYEKEQNIKIEEISIPDLYKKLDNKGSNKYSEFTNKELKEILDYYMKYDLN